MMRVFLLLPLLFSLATAQYQSRYYTIRRDFRKCAIPMCGGYWIALANGLRTRCHDLRLAEECYVEDLDLTALNYSLEDEQRFQEQVQRGGLVLGTFVPTDTGAKLSLKAGWAPFQETDNSPDCNCAEDEACVYDPAADCFDCDCPTICVRINPFCGGFAGLPCPSGLTCIDDPTDDCDPLCGGADCGGICVSIIEASVQEESEVFAQATPTCFIDGVTRNGCDTSTCFDDPNDECSPFCDSEASCKGICADEIGKECGGLLGIRCGPGLTCMDVIGDGCDPRCEPIADCPGRCVPL